jgi:hypothetical protein
MIMIKHPIYGDLIEIERPTDESIQIGLLGLYSAYQKNSKAHQKRIIAYDTLSPIKKIFTKKPNHF